MKDRHDPANRDDVSWALDAWARTAPPNVSDVEPVEARRIIETYGRGLEQGREQAPPNLDPDEMWARVSDALDAPTATSYRLPALALAAAVLLTAVSVALYASGQADSATTVLGTLTTAPPPTTGQQVDTTAGEHRVVGLEGDARVLVDPLTSMTVDSWTEGAVQLRLNNGRIRSEVVRRAPLRTFEVVTPNATVRVHGTVFVTTYHPTHGTRVEGLSGTVSVHAPGQSKPLGYVRGGETLVVAPDGGVSRWAADDGFAAERVPARSMTRAEPNRASTTTSSPSSENVALTTASRTNQALPSATAPALAAPRSPLSTLPPLPRREAATAQSRHGSAAFPRAARPTIERVAQSMAHGSYREVPAAARGKAAPRRKARGRAPRNAQSRPRARGAQADKARTDAPASGEVAAQPSPATPEQAPSLDEPNSDSLAQARAMLAAGNAPGALAMATRLTAKGDGSSALATLRADALVLLGRHSEAADVLRTVADRRGRGADVATLELVRILRTLGKATEARTRLIQYAERGPSAPMWTKAIWQLGDLSAHAGEFEQMKRHWATLVRQRPRSAEANRILRSLLRSSGGAERRSTLRQLVVECTRSERRAVREWGHAGEAHLARAQGDAARLQATAAHYLKTYPDGQWTTVIRQWAPASSE